MNLIMNIKGLPLLLLFCAARAVAEPRPCPNPTVEEVKVKMGRSAAEPTTDQRIQSIPKPRTVIPLRCERPFVYRGEVYSADSPQVQDASTLKHFVQSVPEAAAMVEEYQTTRERSKISAYTGTAGIFLLLFSNTIANRFEPASRNSIRAALTTGGLAIAAGSFVYSIALLRSNEYLLPKAVDTYNQKKPDDPIELHFTAGWSF